MGRVDFAWRGQTRLERFLRSVKVDPETGCWNWIRPLALTGYGQIHLTDRSSPMVAHWFLLGEPRRDHVAHHRCHNRACVRPDHLELMTREQHGRLHGNEVKCEHGDTRRGQRGCLECDMLRNRRNRRKAAAARAAASI